MRRTRQPEERELLMIMIRPEIWRPRNVIAAMVIGGFCIIPAVFVWGSPTAIIGPVSLAVAALVSWLVWLPVRLEITETEVRARQGAARGQYGMKTDAFRSEICSIHYLPTRISFRGPDGQQVMESVLQWTLRDMLRAAEVLQVPLYDHRGGPLRIRELSTGRLVNHSVSRQS
jgi:hypothetical protein